MTTRVSGNTWVAEIFGWVSDILKYNNGLPRGFEIYKFHPRDLEYNVQVTDGPTAALVRWTHGVNVTVDGASIAPPDTSYELIEGKAFVAQGPEVDGKKAELNITFTPSGSPEQHF